MCHFPLCSLHLPETPSICPRLNCKGGLLQSGIGNLKGGLLQTGIICSMLPSFVGHHFISFHFPDSPSGLLKSGIGKCKGGQGKGGKCKGGFILYSISLSIYWCIWFLTIIILSSQMYILYPFLWLWIEHLIIASTLSLPQLMGININSKVLLI